MDNNDLILELKSTIALINSRAVDMLTKYQARQYLKELCTPENVEKLLDEVMFK